jgi:hypothetical protein
MAQGKGFRIPVRAALEQFQRDMKDMKEIGRRAGTETGDAILKEMKAEFQRRQGALREAVAKGVFDKEAAKRISRDFAKEFNVGILEALKQMRKAGKDTTDEFSRLQRSLRNVSTEGGRSARDFNRNWIQQVQGIPGWVRGTFAGGMIAAFTYVAGQVLRVFQRMARGIRDTLALGGQVQEQRGIFEQLTTGRGIDPTAALEAVRRGTRGMISDLELFQRVNFALNAGLQLNTQQMQDLATVSRRLGEAVGKEAGPAWETFVEALSKGQERGLKQFGLITDLSSAMAAWEKQTGRNRKELSDLEQKQIFVNAALAEGLEKVRALGADDLDAADRLDQIAAAWANLKNQAAEAIVQAPAIARLLDGIGTNAEQSAARIQDLADRLGALVQLIAGSPVLRVLFGITKVGLKLEGRALGSVLGIDSDAFETELARIRAARQQGEQLAQTRAEIVKLVTDLEALAARGNKAALTALQQIADSEKEGAAAAAAALGRLSDRKTGGAEDPEKAKRLAEQRARLQERLATELAKLTASAVDEALLQVEKFEREWIAAFGRMDDATARAFARIRDSIEMEGRATEIREQIAAYGKAHLAASTDVLPLLAGLRRLIDGLETERGAMSDTSKQYATWTGLIEDAEKAMVGLAGTTEKLGKAESDLTTDEKDSDDERIRRLRDSARTIGENIHAVLGLAEAFGALDSEAAASLATIADLGLAIGRLAGGDPSALPAVIAGAGQVLVGMLGESAADRERKEALRRNTQALDRLRKAYEEVALTGANLSNIRAALWEGREAFKFRSTDKAVQRDLKAGLQRILADYGLTLADLDALAEELGITIRDKEGRLLGEGLQALYEAAGIAAENLLKFANTAEGIRQKRDFEGRVFDIEDTPARRAQIELDILAEKAPELFKKYFGGLDPNTEAGRRQIEIQSRALARAIMAGDIDPALLGGLTGDDLKEFVLNLDEALDAFAAAAGTGESVTSGFDVSRTITEVTGSRIFGVLTTIAYDVHHIATRYGVDQMVPISAGAAAPAIAAGAGTVINLGGIDVVINGASLPAVTDPASGRRTGAAIGQGIFDGFQDAVDRSAGERTLAYRRARGKQAVIQ